MTKHKNHEGYGLPTRFLLSAVLENTQSVVSTSTNISESFDISDVDLVTLSNTLLTQDEGNQADVTQVISLPVFFETPA